MSEQINTRLLAVKILEQIQRTNAHADVLLDTAFRRLALSHRDRALTTELVYGTIRWKKWLDWVLQKVYHGNWQKIPKRVQQIMETGLYQILYMDKVPDHAAVNESVQLAKDSKDSKWSRVVNGMLRELLRSPQYLTPPAMDKDPVYAISVRWSHPEWVVQKWVDLLGVERTDTLCEVNNERPRLGIRVNLLKSTPDNVYEALTKMGVSPEPARYLKEFFTVPSGMNLVESEAFQNGDFSIQDLSAGLVAHLVDPKPGETIVDLTAAPGGKSTHLAELGKGKVKVLSVDCYPARVRRIQNYIKRLGTADIQPILADGCCIHFKQIDKVLVDAPCSGMGTLQRRGELRWRRKEEDLVDLIALQKKLLNSAADLLSPKGVLVYSTCTIIPDENENVIDDFLKDHHFQVENAGEFLHADLVTGRGFTQTWPDLHGMDGSFAVRLRKIK